MQYVSGGYIGKTLEIRGNDSASLSGVWGINEHFDMRYQGMLQPKLDWNSTTVFCLKGGGIEGNKNIVDATGNQIILNNGVRYSSAQTKYASTSIYFDGSSSLKIPSSSNTTFGSNDFTIEWWEYIISATSPQTIFASEIRPQSYMGMLVGHGTTNRLHYTSTSGTSFSINAASMGAFNVNTWNHFALSRNGTAWRTFKNGTVVTNTTNSGTPYLNETNWSIGAYVQGTPPNVLLRGYIEDFTISIGLGKYTANFTPGEITS